MISDVGRDTLPRSDCFLHRHGCGSELRGGLVRHRPIERIDRGHRADQDEHDQAHALLAVVRTVCERHAAARQDEERSDPQGRRCACRLPVKFRISNEFLAELKQQGGAKKAYEGRYQQRPADGAYLRPVDSGIAFLGMERLIDQTHAEDGTDEGVRARRRQPEIPGCEIPNRRCQEQRKDHGESGALARLQDEFDGQQRHDAEGDRSCRKQHAGEVP